MNSPVQAPPDERFSLMVIGAAVGMGRWWVEKVLARQEWVSVVLADVDLRRRELEEAASAFGCPTAISTGAQSLAAPVPDPGPASEETGALDLVVVAVPPSELASVAQRLHVAGRDGATVIVLSDQLVEGVDTVAGGAARLSRRRGARTVRTDSNLLEGQIVYLAPPARPSRGSVRLAQIIREAGGVLKTGSTAEHDETMKYVQAAAHQTLLNFIDVLVRSGLDLEKDLWAARTPLYEALFGLAARVLDPGQRASIEQIQRTAGAHQIATALLESATATLETIAEAGTVSRRLDELGDGLSGSLMSTARHVAQVAVTAAQATRAELSRLQASGDLVGVRLDRRPSVLHIGHIVEVSPTEVVVDDLLLAGSGQGSVLATGPGLTNQSRVGARGSTRRVVLNLGQIALLSDVDLDDEMDRRLAFIRRDVRFLVPESVSGGGVLSALAGVSGTRGHELVSEVVRTGQRAVVIRVEIRVDRNIDDMVERLRALVQRVYAWPTGICRPAAHDVAKVVYLGPPGTFSEVAARQCAQAVRLPQARLLAVSSFGDVLQELERDAVAVLPISSSASGLVTRAFQALWDAPPGSVTIGGMVDVSVRIDAYIPLDRDLEQLRGAELYSHPQALAQCRQFIRRWRLRPVECGSTAEALRVAGSSVTPAAALAAAGADLRDLPLKVGEREVDDLSGSITRFLIVGPSGAFDQFSSEYVPTTRTIFLGKSTIAADHPLAVDTAAYDEIIGDADGNYLLITSRADVLTHPSLRRLGSAPWSPRTPVVRVQG